MICPLEPLRGATCCLRERIRTFNSRSPRLGRLIFSLHSHPVSVRLVRVHSSASRQPYWLLTHTLVSRTTTLIRFIAQLGQETTALRFSIYLFVDFISV